MKTVLLSFVYTIFCSGLFNTTNNYRLINTETEAPGYNASAQNGLFETDEVLDIQITGNIRELMNDRGETPAYHSLNISYKGADSNTVSIAIEAKARGHFRKSLGGCSYPPLFLHFFKNEEQLSSIFKEQDKLKLVMPCSSDDYVIREWLAYKIYNLITPKSFNTKLVRGQLNDTKKKNSTAAFYAILLEEEEQMAKRNQSVLINRKQVKPAQTEPDAFLTMAVFEYLIGNTDWGVEYLQNIKLLATDSSSVFTAVPYDFDHAGIVGAPYAKPAEELEMSSVRERRYRGYCVTDMQKFDGVIARYNSLRKDIYQRYTDNPLAGAKYIKLTTAYLDDFYTVINSPEKMQREFGYPCNKNGTGNVIIKGLAKD